MPFRFIAFSSCYGNSKLPPPVSSNEGTKGEERPRFFFMPLCFRDEKVNKNDTR